MIWLLVKKQPAARLTSVRAALNVPIHHEFCSTHVAFLILGIIADAMATATPFPGAIHAIQNVSQKPLTASGLRTPWKNTGARKQKSEAMAQMRLALPQAGSLP